MKTVYRHTPKQEKEYVIDFNQYLYGEMLPSVFTEVTPCKVEAYVTDEPVPFKDRLNHPYKEIKIGEPWAKKNFACAWMHLTAKLPAGTSEDNLYIDFDCTGEGLLVDEEGHAVKGFTYGSNVFDSYNYPCWSKRHYPLKGFIHNGVVDLYIDAASNQIQGDFDKEAVLREARVVRASPKKMECFFDYYVLLDYFKTLRFPHPHLAPMKEGLNEMKALWRYDDPHAYEKSKAIANKLFALSGHDDMHYTAVGHAHLDLLWLWPYRETRRKALRTFANQVYLARKYPEYRYVVSQPQQLEFISEDDPKLYKDVMDLLKSGQFEPVGGSWVENDTNVSGEESLVRQELYGQKYWKEHLGHYVNVRWLPDSFGFSGALPQILRESGQKYFVTIKISWCRMTAFPYHTFYWEGIDGSKVLVHMPPEGDYNSKACPQNLLLPEKDRFKKSDGKKEALCVYGIGDGGAGPSEYQVEAVLREGNVPYLPKTKPGYVKDFFESIDGQKLCTHQGEMYLENHRGTGTSQSESKQNNRRFEEEMKSLEMLLASSKDQSEKAAIDKLWKEAMLYQFHDCLPGSCIERVYKECDERYAAMFEAIEGIANKRGYSFEPAKGRSFVNHLSESVGRIVKGEDGYYLLSAGAGQSAPLKEEKKIGDIKAKTLKTDFLKVALKDDGCLGKIVSAKTGKELLSSANRLRVFVDKGDAWNIPMDYRMQPERYLKLESQEIEEYEDFCLIRNAYSYGPSKVSEEVYVYKHRPLIEFHHDNAWKDLASMLRAEFVPSVYSNTIHSEIQFGYLDRPTTDNTDHERAMYECQAQKYIDISGARQGVAVLNCSKSGYYAKEGIISLDLLRSTNYPCVSGDTRRPTSYSYAIYPHETPFEPETDASLGMELNARFLFGDRPFAVPTSGSPDVEVSAFKPSYDGKGMILRVYDKSGRGAKTKLSLPKGFHLVEETDLLEDRVGDASEEIVLKPFEIKTFRLK
jgi:alpha-mannosidase